MFEMCDKKEKWFLTINSLNSEKSVLFVYAVQTSEIGDNFEWHYCAPQIVLNFREMFCRMEWTKPELGFWKCYVRSRLHDGMGGWTRAENAWDIWARGPQPYALANRFGCACRLESRRCAVRLCGFCVSILPNLIS